MVPIAGTLQNLTDAQYPSWKLLSLPLSPRDSLLRQHGVMATYTFTRTRCDTFACTRTTTVK